MTNSPPSSAPLDPALASIGQRWRDAQIPDIYEGCLAPHGGPVSRERARNVRGFFYPKPDLPKGIIEKRTVDGKAYGIDCNIPVQIVWPHASHSPEGPLNTLVYFHGGGFVVGDLDSHEAHAVRLANETDCVVVNVDYRLAPEHRFPAAYDDCLAITRWAYQHIDVLGRQSRRFAIGGDSAGGNLTMVTTMALRDRPAAVPVLLQHPIYPVVTLDADWPSMREFSKGYLLTEEAMAYFGEGHAATPGDYRSEPLNFSQQGMPPSLVTTASLDPLRDQGIAYVEKLKQDGVRVEHRSAEGNIHGHINIRQGIPSAQSDIEGNIAALKTLLAEVTATV